MQHTATTHVAWSVCLSVCLCVCLCVCLKDTAVSLAKADELIDVALGFWTRVGPRNHVLDGGPGHPREEALFVRTYLGISGHARSPIGLYSMLFARGSSGAASRLQYCSNLLILLGHYYDYYDHHHHHHHHRFYVMCFLCMRQSRNRIDAIGLETAWHHAAHSLTTRPRVYIRLCVAEQTVIGDKTRRP